MRLLLTQSKNDAREFKWRKICINKIEFCTLNKLLTVLSLHKNVKGGAALAPFAKLEIVCRTFLPRQFFFFLLFLFTPPWTKDLGDRFSVLTWWTIERGTEPAEYSGPSVGAAHSKIIQSCMFSLMPTLTLFDSLPWFLLLQKFQMRWTKTNTKVYNWRRKLFLARFNTFCIYIDIYFIIERG